MGSTFQCYGCNYTSGAPFSRCPRCHTWGRSDGAGDTADGQASGPKPLSRIKIQKVQRIPTGLEALDIALSGGWVPGMIYLLSGDPGAGKSTLALDLCRGFESAFYVSGEETESAIKTRANRLGIKSGVEVWSVKSLDPVVDFEHRNPPEFRVYDSVQAFVMEGINGIPGSVTQVIACGHAIAEHAHEMERLGFPCVTLVLSQVNKDGDTAGPNALEHLVDATLHLSATRELQVFKNRHGQAPKVVQLKMGEHGYAQKAG